MNQRLQELVFNARSLKSCYTSLICTSLPVIIVVKNALNGECQSVICQENSDGNFNIELKGDIGPSFVTPPINPESNEEDVLGKTIKLILFKE